MKNTLLAALAVTVCSPLFAAPKAETNAPAGATLRLGVAAERLVVSVELGSAAASQSVSLMIDLAAPTVLTLRDDVLQGLKLEAGEKSVSLSAAGGFKASVPRAEIKPYSGTLDLNRVSTLNAAALDDRPLAGTLGASFLQNYSIVLDAQAKELKLLPRGSRKVEGSVVSQVRVDKDGQIHVPVTYGAGSKADLLLASDEYDSSVAAGTPLADSPVKLEGRKGGDAVDLARYVAFRPMQASGADLLRSGVGLLEHFRVEIDWSHKQVALTESLPAADLSADKAFFKAEAADDLGAMAEFIRLHPQSRFREEASRRLLDGRLAGNAPDEAIIEAARGYLQAVPDKARGETALALVTRVEEKHPQRVSMVLGVGDVALEAARGDPKSLERYQIHRLLGTVRLASGDVEGAWKDFLAAVFGLPEDAQVNLNLARIYEKQGRLGRAFSRYQLTAALVEKNASALSDAERAEVKTAVDRLRDKVGKHDS